MNNILSLLLLAASASSLFIQEPESTETESARTESLLYPLILNPWQISHWNCFGTTFYQNTGVSTDYTYNVDVCTTALIAAKLLFPWFYQHQTGHSLLSAFGIDIPSWKSEEVVVDEYAAPVAEGYAAPAVDEYGAPAYQAPQEGYGAPEEVYGAPQPAYHPAPPAYEQRRNSNQAPSFQDRLSVAFKDLSKAVKKVNPLQSHQ